MKHLLHLLHHVLAAGYLKVMYIDGGSGGLSLCFKLFPCTHCRCELCLYDPWRDAVDPDALRRQLTAQGLGESEEGGLAHGVRAKELDKYGKGVSRVQGINVSYRTLHVSPRCSNRLNNIRHVSLERNPQVRRVRVFDCRDHETNVDTK